MRGPKPKTPEQRLKDGSKKRPDHADDPPEYEPDIPDCPEHLAGEARIEWDRLVERLHTAGTLTQEARSTLAGYCLTWQRHIDAGRLVAEHGILLEDGKGKLFKNPACNVEQDALRQMNSFAAELGITPSSRGRVQAVKVETEGPKKRFFKVVG
jgi:P27 family predicted phage terminase small subunit